MAYADEKIPLKITFNNIKMHLSDTYEDDCIFRTANLKRISLKDFEITNFKGNSLLKNYGKNKGKIKLEYVKVDGNSRYQTIVETDEKFTVESI